VLGLLRQVNLLVLLHRKKMKINIRKEALNFNLASNLDDDSYDYEIFHKVFHKDKCLFVFNMNENFQVHIHFGYLDNYVISVELFNELMSVANQRLKEKIINWNKSNMS